MNAVRHSALCALFALVCLPLAQAQLTKGTWVVPLSNLASASVEEEAPGSSSNFWSAGIHPKVGYLFSHRFLAGAALRAAVGGVSGEIQTDFDLLPFARYYFNPLAKRFHVFGEVEMADWDHFTANVGVGLNYFLAPGIGWETRLSSPLTDGFREVGLSSGLTLYFDPQARKNWSAVQSGIGRGTLLLGSTFVNRISNLNAGRFRIGLTPQIGYFLTDRLVLGASVGYYYTRSRFTFPERTVDTKIVQLSPLLRYYLTSGPRRGQWFVEAQPTWQWLSSRSTAAAIPDEKGWQFGFNAGAGVNLFLTKNVALELGLRYEDWPDGRGKALQGRVGINYFLNRK